MAFIRTFGGLSVVSEAAADHLVVHQPRRLALLALLATAGAEGLPRDRVLVLLSPEHDDDSARNSLNKLVHGLRQALGRDAILTEGVALRLNPQHVRSDWAAFHEAIAAGRLAAAVNMVAGRFLEGFHLRDSQEFEEWADAERRRLDARVEQALEQLAGEARAQGALGDAVARWAALAARNPTSDRVAAAYMQCLWERGDAAAALRHGRAHAERVQQELSADPGPAVQDITARIQRALKAPATHAVVSPVAPADPAASAAPSLAPTPAPAPLPPPATIAPAPSPTPAGRRQERAGRPAWRWLAWPRVAALGVVLSGAALWAWRSRAPALDPGLVTINAFEIQATDSATQHLAASLRGQIAAGVASTRLIRVAPPDGGDSGALLRLAAALGRIVGSPRSAKWLVSGRVRQTGDSVMIQAELFNSETSLVARSIPPVHTLVTTLEAAAEAVPQSVMAAIAMELDPRLSGWSAMAAGPTQFEAYQLFAEALGGNAAGEEEFVSRRLQRAASLDTAFFLPALWQLFGSRSGTGRDSLLRALEVRRHRLAPLDRALLDFFQTAPDDVFGRYNAALRLARLAPRCDYLWWIVANASGRANRSAEVLEHLARVDTAGPWMRAIGEASYWSFTRWAAHAEGRFDQALAAARRSMALRPDSRWLRSLLVPDLAALGMVPELLATLEQLRRETAATQGPAWALSFYVNAASELASHGHAAQVGRIVATFDSVIASLPADSQTLRAVERALTAMDPWRKGTGGSVHESAQ